MTESRPAATVHVGLDVHAASILAARARRRAAGWAHAAHEAEVVARAVSRWPRVRCCYEVGSTGYGLARHLRAHGIACDVVAPGLVPVSPGDRIKTDRRDARKLRGCIAGGLLEAIIVPSEQVEALRDLVRAREDARIDRKRDRHRMSKFLLRHGLRMPNKSWGATRRKWLGSLWFEYVHQQAFQTYLHALDLVDRRIEALERDLDAAAKNGAWVELVARLRCLAPSQSALSCAAQAAAVRARRNDAPCCSRPQSRNRARGPGGSASPEAAAAPPTTDRSTA
jgi:transposase